MRRNAKHTYCCSHRCKDLAFTRQLIHLLFSKVSGTKVHVSRYLWNAQTFIHQYICSIQFACRIIFVIFHFNFNGMQSESREGNERQWRAGLLHHNSCAARSCTLSVWFSFMFVTGWQNEPNNYFFRLVIRMRSSWNCSKSNQRPHGNVRLPRCRLLFWGGGGCTFYALRKYKLQENYITILCIH